MLYGTGFEFAALPEGSLIVDVGGGMGNLTMALSKAHKHLRYVVQDRAEVVQVADKVSNGTT